MSKFTGQMQTKDWTKAPNFPTPAGSGKEETKWAVPEKFFDELPDALNEVPPMPGEEVMYANIHAIVDAAQKDPKLKAALVASASDSEKNIVSPLFQFHNYGLPLPNNWTTQNNGAEFGTDYYTRTAVAKSNIFVNSPNETKYFYQDLDTTGARLNGAHQYTVTFTKDAIPPVKGFWSLTMYNEHHFFEPNNLVRYSLGTKNKDLQFAPDGSLTLYVSATPSHPGQDDQLAALTKRRLLALHSSLLAGCDSSRRQVESACRGEGEVKHLQQIRDMPSKEDLKSRFRPETETDAQHHVVGRAEQLRCRLTHKRLSGSNR